MHETFELKLLSVRSNNNPNPEIETFTIKIDFLEEVTEHEIIIDQDRDVQTVFGSDSFGQRLWGHLPLWYRIVKTVEAFSRGAFEESSFPMLMTYEKEIPEDD